MAENVISRTFRKAMASLAGLQFDGARDLYATFGYPRTASIELYLSLYQRQDIAGRIIDAYPDATWREPPAIRARGAEENGPFEKAVNDLAEQIDLWGAMHRLDRLTGIGHYGVLMCGLNGGEALDRPAKGSYKLLYLTPHGEASAQITAWVTDPKDPRYAQPQRYNLTAGVDWIGAGTGSRVLNVDASRVLHVAEHAMQDKAIGKPRLERIVNRLYDLEKLLGGSAEVFWQNAAALRAWVADADVTWEPADKAAMEQQLEEMQNGLRRDVRLRGVTPHLLTATSSAAEAGSIIDRELDFIAGATGVPKRILIGSERGELSSEQDENNWAGRVQERRQQHVSPNMIRPLIERFIEWKILPAPEGGKFDIVWPESDTLGESARADIAFKKAQATAAYVGTPGTDAVIAPEEFRRWLGEDTTSEFHLEDMPEEVETDPVTGLPLAKQDLDQDPEAKAAFADRKKLIANAAPRTLYVRRDVLNWGDLEKWAKGQGFETTVGAEMHVTIAYSRQAVDWMKASETWSGDENGRLLVAPGGPRVVEPMGDGGAHVLMFNSSDLKWRHAAIMEIGASWDYPDYQPHVTISYAPPADLAAVVPYAGAILLGPEIFEEIDDEYRNNLTENARK
jgi:uncharacterized protein